MILQGVTNKRNKQVSNGEEANVDDCIGDDVLNELDRIAKNIVDQCNNFEGGVGLRKKIRDLKL